MKKRAKKLFQVGNMSLFDKKVDVFEVLNEDGTVDNTRYKLVAKGYYSNKPILADHDEQSCLPRLAAIVTMTKLDYAEQIENDINSLEVQYALRACGIEIE